MYYSLDMINGKPLFSSPIRWSTGTWTSSSSMKVEPEYTSAYTSSSKCHKLSLTTSIHSRIMHPLTSNPRCFQGDDQQADTPFARPSGPNSSRAIISPDTIGNPLLRAIDYIMISLPLRSGLNIRNVRPSYMKSLQVSTAPKRNASNRLGYTNHQVP